MMSRRFNLFIGFQIVLITITNFIIVWSMTQTHLQVTRVYFMVILIIQIWYLYYSISKNNRILFEFLKTLKYKFNDDKLVLDLDDQGGKSIGGLLNQFMDSFKKVRIEKEAEYQYFSSIIENVNIGLFTFNENGTIEQINEVAENLLQVKNPNNIASFRHMYPELYEFLSTSGTNQSMLLKIVLTDEILQLSISIVNFVINGNRKKLVSIKNIRNELQQEEIETWKKLISVLTHEIMNSTSPITSLSSTLIETFQEGTNNGEAQLDQQAKDSILLGLTAIQKRSTGLSKFIETYRSLTKIPQPKFSEFLISDLLRYTIALMKDEVSEQGNNLILYPLNQELSILADEKLISQVLINLIRNANQALTGKKKGLIELKAYKNELNKTIVELKDNGIGIPRDHLDKVFIPFYTTKENGSGIGLSLSRQIMGLHKGQIDIKSIYGEGTTIRLTF